MVHRLPHLADDAGRLHGSSQHLARRPNLTSELHFGKSQIGIILGSFSLGYALMQFPGGWLSDRLGSKPLLLAGLVVWSLFTGFTGLCVSLISFVIVRAAFGLGEGLENGAQFKLIGDHFDERERSKANGVFLSSLALGPAIATPASAWLIRALGWRPMFFTFAGVGIAVAVILSLFLPFEGRPLKAEKADLGEILKKRQVWILLFGYLLFNIAFWGFIGWTPTYLREQRHLSLSDLGWMGAVPYLCGFAGLLVIGQLGSKRFFGNRQLLVSICYFGAAISFYCGLRAGSSGACIAGLSFAAFFLYSAFAPFWALSIDLASATTRGGLTGLINFGGQLGGFVGQYAIGMLAGKMHTFNGTILFMSGALVVGSVVLLGFRPQEHLNGYGSSPI